MFPRFIITKFTDYIEIIVIVGCSVSIFFIHKIFLYRKNQCRFQSREVDMCRYELYHVRDK